MREVSLSTTEISEILRFKSYLQGLYTLNTLSELCIPWLHLQDLSVIVSSKFSDDVIEIVEDNERVSSIDIMCMLHQTEWKISDLVYCEKSIYHRELAEAYLKHPVLLVKCVAKRKAGFFIHNIIVITVCIYLPTSANFWDVLTFTKGKSKDKFKLKAFPYNIVGWLYWCLTPLFQLRSYHGRLSQTSTNTTFFPKPRYFSHMLQQRWEGKIRRKENSRQPGIELSTTRLWVWHAHHWANGANVFPYYNLYVS